MVGVNLLCWWRETANVCVKIESVFLCISIVALSTNVASAAVETSGEILYRLSRLESQIQQIPEAIGLGFDQSPDAYLSDEYLSDDLPGIRNSVIESFSPAKLKNSVIASLERSLDEIEVNQIVTWHLSELGRKITTLESERSNLTSDKQKLRIQKILIEISADDDRLVELAKLRDAWNMTESSVDMMIDMQIAVSIAMLSPGPDSGEMLRYIQDLYEEQRSELSEHYERETLMSMLYVYDGLAIGELERYREFVESPTGSSYVDAVNLSLHRAMIEGSLSLGSTLARISRIGESQKSL